MGVDGGLPDGEAAAVAGPEGERRGLAVAAWVAWDEGRGVAAGLGVGLGVDVGGAVTVIVPPPAVAPDGAAT